MNDRKQDALLGLIFFSALFGLGAVTILLSDFRLGVTLHEVTLLSDDVGFLRTGDPVLVYGMTSGKVTALERLSVPVDVSTADGQLVRCTVAIRATLDLDPAEHLRRDHRVLIEDRGVLGGKLIRIDTGKAIEPARSGEPLLARASASVLQAAGAILEENREGLKDTIDNLSAMTAKAAAGEGPLGKLLNDQGLSDRLDQLMTNLADLSDTLANGDGTLGRLITDAEMYDTAQAFLGDMRELSAGLVAGEGTLGKLLREDTAHDQLTVLLTDLRDGVTDAREMLARLEAGEGTLGKLLTDDAIYEDARVLFADLAVITTDLREGQGTMGRLFTDSALYDNANAMVNEIRDAVSGITSGDGLMAMLINDAGLAADLRSFIAQALGAIEDARETTPVQSLGSFLFGTF